MRYVLDHCRLPRRRSPRADWEGARLERRSATLAPARRDAIDGDRRRRSTRRSAAFAPRPPHARDALQDPRARRADDAGAADVHLGHDRRAQGRDADATRTWSPTRARSAPSTASARGDRVLAVLPLYHINGLARHDARAARARRQPGDAASLLGASVLGRRSTAHRLHLDQRGADDHLLPARTARRRRARRRYDRVRFCRSASARAAARAPSRVRGDVRHRHRRDHGPDRDRRAVVLAIRMDPARRKIGSVGRASGCEAQRRRRRDRQRALPDGAHRRDRCSAART